MMMTMMMMIKIMVIHNDGNDYDDDDANDMQKFYPGNLDWFGELRNLGTSHEVGLLCGNMKKHVENLETRRKCRTR